MAQTGSDDRRRGPCTAFEGHRRLVSGPLDEVARHARSAFGRSSTSTVLVFDDATGEQIDLDYGGTEAEMLRSLMARESARLRGEAAAAPAGPGGPGRPRLGVVAREVTLLPRHWQWLAGQPGGASAALRRLVDEARRASVGRDRVRRAQEVAYRVMAALAGNLPGFEEAIRALFAGDAGAFAGHVAAWPPDVAAYVSRLAGDALNPPRA